MITTITITIDHDELQLDKETALSIKRLTGPSLTCATPYDRQALVAVLVDYLRDDAVIVEHTTSWVAGWNTPGYLPDNEPVSFTSFHNACSYLVDELEAVARERRDASAACGGDAMRELNRQVRDYECAMEYVTKQSCTVSDGQAPAEPFFVTVGNYVWWVAREEQS